MKETSHRAAPVPDLSIDGLVCSLALVERRTFCSFPRETFAVKPLPFACAFSNTSRPSFVPFFFLTRRPTSPPIFPSSIFRLRASTTPLSRFHFASYRLPPFLPKPKDLAPAISLMTSRHHQPPKVGKRDSRKSEFVLVTN